VRGHPSGLPLSGSARPVSHPAGPGPSAGLGWSVAGSARSATPPPAGVRICLRCCTTRVCSRPVCACVCAATFRVCEGLHI